MEFKTETGELVDIDFYKVDCYRGSTLQSGGEGTKVYFKDGTEITLDVPFSHVMEAEELLKQITYNP